MERKLFEIAWKEGSGGRELLITERGKKKEFKVFLSKNGGVWLVETLWQLHRREVEGSGKGCGKQQGVLELAGSAGLTGVRGGREWIWKVCEA